MLFLVDYDKLALIMLLVCIVPIAILIIWSLVKGIKKQKHYNEIKKEADNEPLDEGQKEEFVNAFGGTDNITKIEQKLSRLMVSVKSLESVNMDNLKALGASGILVSEDTVTVTFGDRASYIYKMLTTEESTDDSKENSTESEQK